VTGQLYYPAAISAGKKLRQEPWQTPDVGVDVQRKTNYSSAGNRSLAV